MGILLKLGRLWVILCPLALLVLIFKYAHQLNSILNSIEGMSFKKTLVALFIVFIALWSLLHLSSVLFVRAIVWVWNGQNSTSTKELEIRTQEGLETPFKDNIEHHSIKEQENLFKLDLQSEPIDSLAKEN